MVAADVEALFTPLKIGDLALRNRIVMASLTRWRSVPSNVPNEVNVEYYAQRAISLMFCVFHKCWLTDLSGRMRPASGELTTLPHGKRLSTQYMRKGG